MSKPLGAIIILDGFGMRDEQKGNAVKQAHKPNFDRFWKKFPHGQLEASGEAVGLPKGQMGNSEVGHLNIGAGRIVYQNFTRINKAIENGSFFDIEALINSVRQAKKQNKALHILGLLSDGGVHSHIDHLFAVLKLAADWQLKEVYVHAFLDGRDVAQKSAATYIRQLKEKITEYGVGKLATISGRYYAMDRDNRWDRVKKAYDVIAYGQGPQATDPYEAITASYEKGTYDEFFEPTVMVDDDGRPVGTVQDNDSVVFYNFRPDRAIQISRAFTNKAFKAFDRGSLAPRHLTFVMMTDYSDEITGDVAFKPEELTHTVGEVLSDNNMKQLRIAETEKYPHVTYFASGGQEEEFPGEKRVLIDSPSVSTYDLKPEMSVYEVTDALLEELDKEIHNAVILNFANPDMVGHSGKLEPTVKAVEAVDECLGKVVDKITELGGYAIIFADHGNSDEVVTLDDKPMTTHTKSPVPVIVTKDGVELRKDGILADVAPTLLDLLNIEKPTEMTGNTLIK